MTDLAFRNVPPQAGKKPSDLSAVLYREFALLAGNRVNLILGLTPMLVYLLLVNTALSNLVQSIAYQGTELPFAVFLLPFVLAMSVVSASGTSGMALFQEELSGVTTQLWSYPVRRSRFLLGKLLAGVSLVLVQTLLGLGISALIFDFPFGLSHWLGLLAALTLSAVAFNGLYMAAATTIKEYQTFMVLTSVSMPALVFSAPSMYTVEHMPLLLQWMSVVNPVTYAVNGMRDALVFGLASAWPHLLVLTGIAIVSYGVAGWAMLKRSRDM